VLPILGFDQYTKVALERKNKGHQLIDEDDDPNTAV